MFMTISFPCLVLGCGDIGETFSEASIFLYPGHTECLSHFPPPCPLCSRKVRGSRFLILLSSIGLCYEEFGYLLFGGVYVCCNLHVVYVINLKSRYCTFGLLHLHDAAF